MGGVSAKGLPFSQRGGLTLDAAAMLGTRSPVPLTVMDVLARIPVADRTQLDLVAPIAFGAMGNPMIGARHVFRVHDQVWISLGGHFGLPLVDGKGLVGFSAARGYWDSQAFARQTVPFAVRTGLEYVEGIASLRVQLEPVFGIAIDHNVEHLFAIQHAVELQLGHVIGGGLRYQGVGMVTEGFSGSKDDRYQATLEPFLRLQRDPIFARLGVMMPLDKPLGAPFENGWGARVVVGYSLD